MKLFLKSVVITVLGIGLLGTTSGCGKKFVRGSSGSNDQKIARASVKPALDKQQNTSDSTLSGLDQAGVSQEFDLDTGTKVAGGERQLKSSENISKNPRFGRERPSRFAKESTGKAMSTAPASTSSSRFDSSIPSSGVRSAESFDQSAALSYSPKGQPGHDPMSSSSSNARRKGVTFSNGLNDIYFEFDSWRLSDESRSTLEANAEWLKSNPHKRITIEGHCDERGTQAYNYVLGEKRATMVQQYLSFLGVPHHQLVVTSFGKDKPKCRGFSENCFQRNRRAHFASDQKIASQQ